MAIPENVLPKDMSNFITSRNQIWERWRVSQAQGGQLNARTPHISQQVQPEPVSPLTQSKTPPAELGAVLPLIDNFLNQGDQINAKILEHQAAVQRLKSLERKLLIISIIVAIIILAVLAHAIHLF